jgi:hypothetical protein
VPPPPPPPTPTPAPPPPPTAPTNVISNLVGINATPAGPNVNVGQSIRICAEYKGADSIQLLDETGNIVASGSTVGGSTIGGTGGVVQTVCASPRTFGSKGVYTYSAIGSQSSTQQSGRATYSFVVN